jgi:hypothetical protein
MSPQTVAPRPDKCNANRSQERRYTRSCGPAIAAKAIDRPVFSLSLNAAVENAIINALAGVDGQAGSKPAVAMTRDEERELREQLARLQQEHRDLDAAIAALAMSPGSDVIQVQRLKKRKLVLRDKIRSIEDQLTPDIIA